MPWNTVSHTLLLHVLSILPTPSYGMVRTS